jgi:two-component system, LytTR family, sensor kinase
MKILSNNRSKTVLTHIIVWAFVFSLPFILSSSHEGQSHESDDEGFTFVPLNTITNIFWVGLFYFNAYVLTPKFIYRKKYPLYIILILAIFSAIMLVHGVFFEWLITGRDFNFFNSSYHNLLPFLFTITISTAYKSIIDQSKADELVKEKQQENLKTELSFLRSQISPHFIFNVLNNMVAMVRLKSDELEPTIIKLSSLMQYMLYETDEEKVLLKSEVEYLQSYIELQQQRFGSKLKLDVLFDVPEDWHTIEPMLLIPFVENAFKHGVGLIENPEIDISLQVNNNLLHFTVKNKYNNTTDEAKDKTSGIGLVNVKRRLQLLYDKRHELNIQQKNGWFTISLQINLR